MNLLVVDFDYFFRVCERPADCEFDGEMALYDWGHSEESSVFFETIWPIRAGAFLFQGRPLPRCDDEALRTFWSRFRFAPHTRMFMADSNMYAAHERVRPRVDNVWLYDAHHDAGYHPDAVQRLVSTSEVDCENWMLVYAALDAELHMRYPTWRHYGPRVEPEPAVTFDRQVDDGSTPDVTFDRVFLCKSPAWVPSWCDDQWLDFVQAAPFRQKHTMGGMKPRRRFDLADAERRAEETREMNQMIERVVTDTRTPEQLEAAVSAAIAEERGDG